MVIDDLDKCVTKGTSSRIMNFWAVRSVICGFGIRGELHQVSRRLRFDGAGELFMSVKCVYQHGFIVHVLMLFSLLPKKVYALFIAAKQIHCLRCSNR